MSCAVKSTVSDAVLDLDSFGMEEFSFSPNLPAGTCARTGPDGSAFKTTPLHSGSVVEV